MTTTKAATRKIEVAARKAERARMKHTRFMSRTLSIYRNQQARLRLESHQDDAELPYSLEEFRAWFQAGLDRGCCYTAAKLTLKTAAVDHDVPVSRGGSWAMSNLALCTEQANHQKGPLTGEEFRDLLHHLESALPADIATGVKRRLSAGGKALANGFRRAA